MASPFPNDSSNCNSPGIPITKATPAIAIAVPGQNHLPGRSLKKNIIPNPTHTGARLASKVEMDAFESIIELFHRAISIAKSTPQLMATFTPFQSLMGLR